MVSKTNRGSSVRPPLRPADLSAVGPNPVPLSAAVSDRTVLLFDPETGKAAGTHRVITFPGGKPDDDPDSAAEALEIEPARRRRLKPLLHEGALEAHEELAVELAAGRPRLIRRARRKPG